MGTKGGSKELRKEPIMAKQDPKIRITETSDERTQESLQRKRDALRGLFWKNRANLPEELREIPGQQGS
jgi:hypothetical protein